MHPRPIILLILALCAFSAPVGATPPDTTISTYATGALEPNGIAFDASGNLYATGAGGGGVQGVWKAPPGGGALTLLFGNTSVVSPWGVVCDASGNVYFAEQNGSVVNGGRIRKVTPGGVGSVFKSGIQAPTGLAMDASGNLCVGEYNGHKVVKITPAGVMSDYATGIGGVSESLFQIDFDDSGNLYVGSENRIFRIGPGGSPVTTAVSGLNEGVGFVRWVGDNFIVAQFGFRTLVYTSPTRGNPPAKLVNTALVDHCVDGKIPSGASAGRPTFMTLYHDVAYFGDAACSSVRRFYLPSQPVPVAKRSWGAVKAIYR